MKNKIKPNKKAIDVFTGTQVGMLIEELQGQFRVFGEGLEGLIDKVDGLEQTQARMWEDITQIKLKLNSIEKRLTAVEKRLDAVEKRLDAVEKRLDAVEKRLDAVEKRLNTIELDIKIIKAEINEIKLNPKADRQEVIILKNRLKIAEEKLETLLTK